MTNITVVTPVYNTQDYLHRCIKSVLEQQGVSLRYILVDDGSTDNSAAIARFYAQQDDRIVFVQKANAGQGAARNIGIRLADSEYIYFVDSDDHLGKDTLRVLYDQARAHDLDICSPAVPKHYFDKPLEYVACLPCKSQFIRMDIIRRYGILQPTVRSGQDGVFSHLVLAHCRRIGMATDATFHYTHAREGSTFASYLKRHDAVPGIVAEHYAAIEEHYERHKLWKANALRLLSFITSETLKNRVDPHLPHFTSEQTLRCFEVLCAVAKKAFSQLDVEQQRQVTPVVTALAKNDARRMAEIYIKEFVGKDTHGGIPPAVNTMDGKTLICIYRNKNLVPSVALATASTLPKPTPAPAPQTPPAFEQSLRALRDELRAELRTLRGKVDLSINTLNNATVQIASSLHSQPSNVQEGVRNLVVSLTTLPARLHTVHFAIESIFAQSVLPGRVVLWVSEEVRDQDIPAALAALKGRGLEIRRVRDIGPHTKLIYALREFTDRTIVTVDDDVIYPANALQALWEQHQRFPKAVVCNWARELAFGSDGSVKGVREGRLLTPPLLEREIEQAERYVAKPSLLAFPYGTSGVLYPAGSLSDQVFDIDALKKLCPKEDDIWFKAMSLLKGTPVVTTNLGINPIHHCLTGSQHVALRHDNHALSQNEKQMMAVFQHFGLHERLRGSLELVSAK